MRVLELFGGYGSQALALENLGIDFKSDLCDIDKYAVQAYNQIHGETFNYGDICSIDETKLPYYDLITYSSPCQDFSQAGKQAGGEKGAGNSIVVDVLMGIFKNLFEPTEQKGQIELF